MRSSLDFFAALIEPIATDDFFTRYWEKDFLHLERNRPGLYDEYFSLADVDRWLVSTRTGDPDGALLVPPAGSEVSVQRFRAGELPLDKAYESLAEGHTLILNQMERSWPGLAPICERLGEVFCSRVAVNAYLTPKGSRAFPVHIDNHDAFILQVFGEKVWRLNELEHLPVHGLDLGAELEAPPLWENLESKPLRSEIVLHPGDVLYLPRGMPHCAVARDAPSLHLTVSLNALHWVDFLKGAVEQACYSLPELRLALPPRFVADPAVRRGMERDFAAIVAAFASRAAFEPTLAAVLRRRLKMQGFPQDGQIEHLLRVSELQGDSRLERRPGVMAVIETVAEKNACRLRFGTSLLQGPERLRRTLEFVRDRERFQVSELPGLDAGGQVVLARRFLRLGLLRFVAE